ncbi:hypothetical protein SDC9_196359 [bioreactor metagenome]|uniref:Uncharacterized protein n=1 Tax=bioreactor metagenome TaxID=1076179 RepID=A0A645IBY7_9ZZZZ
MLAPLGRDNDNGDKRVHIRQHLKNGPPVIAAQVDIQDGQINRILSELLDCLGRVPGGKDLETLGLKQLLQRAANRSIVIYNKQILHITSPFPILMNTVLYPEPSDGHVRAESPRRRSSRHPARRNT